MLAQAQVFPELAPFLMKLTKADIARVQNDKQVVSDAEIAKESHDELLPTLKQPVLSSLTIEERNICAMIYKRLLAQFLPGLEEAKTTLVLRHGDNNFIAKGKIVKNPGWTELYSTMKDSVLPNIQQGNTLTANGINPLKKKTTPPKRLTQATLLAAMKTIASQVQDVELRKSLADSQGIGTPATRASIIDGILAKGYIRERKKSLYITDKGKRYIENMAGLNIITPEFAADLDLNIKRVQRGEDNFEHVYSLLVSNLRVMCSQLEGDITRHICPFCHSRMKKNNKTVFCNCGFTVFNPFSQCLFSETELDDFLTSKTFEAKDFISKKGNSYQAILTIENDKTIKMSFPSRK